ncbi:MAG TPA: hypothetical protein VK761_05130, partial [Solirubrobacteraceae bacterium]|nr:hypothetical protein [Solirubrobacteraceae bacterium]
MPVACPIATAACVIFAALALSSGARAAEPVPALLGAVATTTQQVLAPVAQAADLPTPTSPPATASAAGVASSVDRVAATISDTVATARPPVEEPVAAQPASASAPTLIPLHTTTTQTGHRVADTVTARAPAVIATTTRTTAATPDRAERVLAQSADEDTPRHIARSAELPPGEVHRPATVADAHRLLATLTRAVVPTTLAQAPGDAIGDLVGPFEGLGPIAPNVALLRPLLEPLHDVLDPLLDAAPTPLSAALAPLTGVATQPLSPIRTQSTSSAGAAAISPVALQPGLAREQTGLAREIANGASAYAPVMRAKAEREQISTPARAAPSAAGQTALPASSERLPTSRLPRASAATTRGPLLAQASPRATGGASESPATGGSAGGFGLALALALSMLLLWIAPRGLRRLRVASDS